MEPVLSENTVCRICSNTEYTLACTKGTFQYVTCSQCGVTRHYPYPTAEQTDAFYADYLQIKHDENPLYMSDTYWQEFKRAKALTLKEMGVGDDAFAGKKVLDIGCATGLFVQYANELGAKGSGIDISAGLIEIAKSKGLDCEQKNLFDVHEKFDLINFSHVVEHVADPVQFLTKIFSIINDGGMLVMETPCTGIISESFSNDWRFYMPIEHLHLFSQQSLFRILNDIGFSVNSWTRFGSGNTTGKIPAVNKKVADTIAKKMGIGDTISILCKKI